MKRIKFYCVDRYGSEQEEIFEFDTDTTEGEIEEEFQAWLCNHCDFYREEV